LRTCVISVSFQDRQSDNSDIEEFIKLAHSLSVLEIKSSTLLRLSKRDPGFLISKGHLDKIRAYIAVAKIGLVLIDNSLTPVQQRNLENFFSAKVLDRTGLVLEIFGSRAQSREGILQVELAHLLHQKSRLVRSWTHLERQRGGKGFLGGPGETQIESDRRSLATKITTIKKAVKKVKKTRNVQRSLRLRNNMPLVSFVGYTNAGKSTLFNSFPNKKTKSENKLFSTLDPFMKRCGRLNKEYIISDTVGFIKNLPTSLIIAFRATLEEISYSDLIIHVVDVSEEDAEKKSEVVYRKLETLGIKTGEENNIVEVHNKIDLSTRQNFSPFLKGLPKQRIFSVSAKNGLGIKQLFRGIEELLYNKEVSEKIILDSSETDKIEWLYRNQIVQDSELKESNIELVLKWSNDQKEIFSKNFLGEVL
jgi:GTP-binding protein HflX